MNIETVVNEVFLKTRKAVIESCNPDFVPNLEIYMSFAYYQKCAAESQNPHTYDLVRFKKIMGFHVWLVPNRVDGEKLIKHPDFLIVDLDKI